MRTLKPILGVLGALVPVIYCGGLLYYFLDFSGSTEEAVTNGLGPTLLGLALVGLLFCIPLLVKIVRMLVALRSPGSAGRVRPDPSTQDGDGFDPDAVLARYMERRAAEGAPGSPTTAPAQNGGAPAPRPTFGRKIK